MRTPKLTLSSPLTYSAWMYADSDAAWWGSVPTGARGSFGRYYQNDSVNMWKSGAATMTTRVGITIDGASYLSTAPQPSFAAKTWVYIAVTYDGTAIKYQMIYINYHIIKRINQ
ncbi:MAG TPA: hypothetical protein DC049_02590 [Spirochaetia bacterium]|nr:hypothetical protein [Spirochaetia bacterium]